MITVLALKYRNIETLKSMNTEVCSARKGRKAMEFLIVVGLLVAWIILQVWVLPHFGVKT